MNSASENNSTADASLNRPLLSIAKLCCERSEIALFSNLSFSLEQGECMRISGPNGSGKTTLLRTIAGIHKPIRGQIFWNLGEQQERKSTDRPKLAYIGHASGLRGELTAIENLQFYASIMRDQCVLSPLECLHKLGIEHCSALPCNQLSAGQRQRVALARLGLSRYDIWLLDEPITSLDDQGIELFVDLANNYLKAEGSVLYCSHQSLKLGLGRNSASIDLRDAQNKYSQC